MHSTSRHPNKDTDTGQSEQGSRELALQFEMTIISANQPDMQCLYFYGQMQILNWIMVSKIITYGAEEVWFSG